MPKEAPNPDSHPIPPEPHNFTSSLTDNLQGPTDGKRPDEAAVSGSMEGMFDRIAAGLYSLASMLVGEGEDSIRLVETAVATAEVSACSHPEQAHSSSRTGLAKAAVELIAERSPESLAAPEGLEHAKTCIGDDDLDAAAEAREAMERIIAGPDRDRLRDWLESLPTALRTIYVLRAVAGLSAADTAALLAECGGPRAAGWNAEAVRELFRQGLCSLASQLIHAASLPSGSPARHG